MRIEFDSIETLPDTEFTTLYDFFLNEKMRRDTLKAMSLNLTWIEIEMVNAGKFTDAIKHMKDRLNCSLMAAKKVCDRYQDIMRYGERLTISKIHEAGRV